MHGGAESSRSSAPPRLRLVPPLTEGQIAVARAAREGRVIAEAVKDFPSRSDNPPALVFNLDTKLAEPAQTSGTSIPPTTPPKKSWRSLRESFKKHASTTVRNVILPAAAGFGVKQAAAYALALLPGGFVIGAAVGASASLLTGLAHDRLKGQKSSRTKHFARAVTGAVSGMIGVDAADGFESLKSAFNSVKGWLPSFDRDTAQKVTNVVRVAAQPASDVLHEAAELNKKALQTFYRVSELRAFDAAKTASQKAGEHMRLASEKAKEAARRAANAAQEERIQALQQEWNSAPITETIPPNSSEFSAPSEFGTPSTLTKGLGPASPTPALSVPSTPRVPIATVDAPAPVANAAAPSGDVRVSLQLPGGAEVSGPVSNVLSLQADLNPAAPSVPHNTLTLADGSTITAEVRPSAVPDTVELPGGDTLTAEKIAEAGSRTAGGPIRTASLAVAPSN